jgi:hypothetical protein
MVKMVNFSLPLLSSSRLDQSSIYNDDPRLNRSFDLAGFLIRTAVRFSLNAISVINKLKFCFFKYIP